MLKMQPIEQFKKYAMPTYNRYEICIDHAKGNVITDISGKKYVDFFAGIAVNALGYNNKYVNKKAIKQIKKHTHVSNLFHQKPQSELLEKLIVGSDFSKGFLSNSGAEANECALKLARKYFYDRGEDKYEIITATNSFHGRTLATVTLTGQEKYSKYFAPLPNGIVHVPYNDFDAVASAVNEHTCAIMLEVIQGEGGVIPIKREYAKKLMQLCEEKNLLLIIDEIQTGIYRTGTKFAYMQFGLKPNIITLAKALGGGYPIGCTLADSETSDTLTAGSHGTTFGGNPVSAAAAIATLEYIENNLLEKIPHISSYLANKLTAIADSHKLTSLPRGAGLMLGLELNNNMNASGVASGMLKNGFIVGTAGGNTLRFTPPLTITEREIDAMASTLSGILTALNNK